MSQIIPKSDAPATVQEANAQPQPAAAAPLTAPAARPRAWRRWVKYLATLLVLAAVGYHFAPTVAREFNTVSTDDAYVNGHVTFVAPRVPGQVLEVCVDDNNRVKKGDLLVRIDAKPFQVKVELKRAAVRVAEGDLAAAESQARGLEALARSQRWKTQTAVEQVNNHVALLKARAAALKTREAILDRARADYERTRPLVQTGALSREEFDQRLQDIRVAEAALTQAREEVYQVRVSLGLAPNPGNGKELTDVPPGLDQTRMKPPPVRSPTR